MVSKTDNSPDYKRYEFCCSIEGVYKNIKTAYIKALTNNLKDVDIDTLIEEDVEYKKDIEGEEDKKEERKEERKEEEYKKDIEGEEERKEERKEEEYKKDIEGEEERKEEEYKKDIEGEEERKEERKEDKKDIEEDDEESYAYTLLKMTKSLKNSDLSLLSVDTLKEINENLYDYVMSREPEEPSLYPAYIFTDVESQKIIDE